MYRPNRWNISLVGIVLWCVILIALLLDPLEARAHAEYERSDPPAGAVIPAAPDAVHIWFTQELFRREGENWIEVLDPDGMPAHQGEALIDDDDRAYMWVPLQAGLDEGEYLVRWRSLSADDGDTDEGEFTFLVDPNAPVTTPTAASPTAGPTPTQAPTDDAATPEAQPPAGIPCLGSAILGLGLVAFRWRRRRS